MNTICIILTDYLLTVIGLFTYRVTLQDQCSICVLCLGLECSICTHRQENILLHIVFYVCEL